jgi:hypothetical protein
MKKTNQESRKAGKSEWRIRRGCYRIVFLIGRYAIKIPNITDGFELFLKGLLQNIQEATTFKRKQDHRLCPVLLSLNGFILVMTRAKELEAAPSEESLHAFIHAEPSYRWCVELKSNSFGVLPDGRMVAIDYGSKCWADESEAT